MSEKCWICGEPADTREHRLKASDLQQTFGPISESRPIFQPTGSGTTKIIKSPRADRLKYRAKICNRCNSSLSQPYDLAWQKVSVYLDRVARSPVRRTRLDLCRALGGNSSELRVALQLFFAKQWGCIAIDQRIDVDTSRIASCLRSAQAYPHLYLSFLPLRGAYGESVFTTNVRAIDVDGTIRFAYWYYRAGRLAVNVTYSTDPRFKSVLTNHWNPLDSSHNVPVGSAEAFLESLGEKLAILNVKMPEAET